MPNLHTQLVSALQASNLTPTGLGHVWSAENDRPPRTNEQQVRRLLTRLPKSVEDLEALLDAIGFELVVQQKQSPNLKQK